MSAAAPFLTEPLRVTAAGGCASLHCAGGRELRASSGGTTVLSSPARGAPIPHSSCAGGSANVDGSCAASSSPFAEGQAQREHYDQLWSSDVKATTPAGQQLLQRLSRPTASPRP